MADKTEWVLVPRVATPEMVQASNDISCRAEGEEHWAAMLAAAPQPPSGGERGEVVVTRAGTHDGPIVAVTRQDSEGRILSVIAEAAPPSAPVGAEPALLHWVKAQADDPNANPRFRELYTALSQQPAAEAERKFFAQDFYEEARDGKVAWPTAAPQPPAEAQDKWKALIGSWQRRAEAAGYEGIEGALEAAEAQAQGGGGVVAHGFYDPATGAYSETQRTPRWLPAVVCTAPPSAPVGVERKELIRAARSLRKAERAIGRALAQRPAPVAPAPVAGDARELLAQQLRKDGHATAASVVRQGEENALLTSAIKLIAALAQQPAVEQDCDNCGGFGDVSGEYPGDACPDCRGTGKVPAQQPAAGVGEEIMVNAAHDVYTLPLQPSGLLSGPRFVVHVPGPEQPAAVDGVLIQKLRRYLEDINNDDEGDGYLSLSADALDLIDEHLAAQPGGSDNDR